jgi:hypothetical protein
MLLNNYNPMDIQTRVQSWRDEGWQGAGMQDQSMSDVRSSDYSYNRSAAVPVTGSDMDDDDDMLNDPSMHRDTGDVGVTGMPYDRNRDRDFGTSGSASGTFRREDEEEDDLRARDQLSGWNRDKDKMDEESPTFGIGPSSDIDASSAMGDASYGAGSTYDRDVNRFGGSNIPVTGDDQNFNNDMDDDTGDMDVLNDHLRDDVYGKERGGVGDIDIPVTGSSAMDMANTETNVSNWDMYDRSFQADYRTRYGMTSYGYEYYQPAYRFGYDLANDPRYRASDWDSFEIDVRNDWEMRGSQGAWEDVKAAVRHAWRSVTGR